MTKWDDQRADNNNGTFPCLCQVVEGRGGCVGVDRR